MMDYLFRWLELRFLKGEQGILFELPRLVPPKPESGRHGQGTRASGRAGRCTRMSVLRLADGEKRFLLSLHGMWQHELDARKGSNWSTAWRKA